MAISDNDRIPMVDQPGANGFQTATQTSAVNRSESMADLRSYIGGGAVYIISAAEIALGIDARVVDTSFPVGNPLRYEGADPTGVTYSTQALKDAIAAASYYMSTGFVPIVAGVFKSAESLLIFNRVGIGGLPGYHDGYSPSIIQFDDDLAGIVIHNSNTTCDSDGTNQTTKTEDTDPSGRKIQGDGTVIDNLTLRVGGRTATAPTGDGISHGIRLRARAEIKNVYIRAFAGNGVHIEATQGGAASVDGNANEWKVDTVRVIECAGNGFFTDGNDVNAGEGALIDATLCGGWGIYDSSFLGNTYTAAHVASNTGGPIKADNANARNVFVGCYVEPGQGDSEVDHRSIIIGGHFLVNDGSAPSMQGESFYGRYNFKGRAGVNTVDMTVQADVNEQQLIKCTVSGDHAAGVNFLKYDTSSGVYYVGQHGNASSKIPMIITTDNTTGEFGRAATQVPGGEIRLKRFFFGDSDANGRMWEQVTAVPSSGERALGELLWNRGNGPLAWRYSAAGDPGTTQPILDNTVRTLDNAAVPDHDLGDCFKTGGTTAITNIIGAIEYDTHIITIHARHTITITDGAPMSLAAGGNFGMFSGDTLTLQSIDGVWEELHRRLA